MAKGTVAKNNAIKAEKTNQVKAAEPKTNEKASDVLQAAKNAAQDVKTAVKESASEVKAAVTEKTAAVKEAVEEKAAEVKSAEEKTTAVKSEEPAKKTAAKKTTTRKTTAAKKTTTKTAAKTTAAKKAEPVTEVYVQYWGKEIHTSEVADRIKKIWTDDMGKKATDLKDLKIYIKPEDNGAHYVINGDVTGFIGL